MTVNVIFANVFLFFCVFSINSYCSYDASGTDKFADAVEKYDAGALSSDCAMTIDPADPGVVEVDTNASPQRSHYVIEATVENIYNGTSSFIQVLAINTNEQLIIKYVYIHVRKYFLELIIR